ncbi:MAG: response regulator transcription factor [Rivularia sp. (in: cyanobacteria)]
MTKILMIESQLQICNVFLKCLETEGFDVIVAENGVVGIRKVQSELPDLIISDLIMSESEDCNQNFLQALREHPTTAIIPLIVAIDRDQQADIRKVMEIGADDCITKSCTSKQLLNAIKVRLDRLAFFQQWCVAQFKEKN